MEDFLMDAPPQHSPSGTAGGGAGIDFWLIIKVAMVIFLVLFGMQFFYEKRQNFQKKPDFMND